MWKQIHFPSASLVVQKHQSILDGIKYLTKEVVNPKKWRSYTPYNHTINLINPPFDVKQHFLVERFKTSCRSKTISCVCLDQYGQKKKKKEKETNHPELQKEKLSATKNLRSFHEMSDSDGDGVACFHHIVLLSTENINFRLQICHLNPSWQGGGKKKNTVIINN